LGGAANPFIFSITSQVQGSPFLNQSFVLVAITMLPLSIYTSIRALTTLFTPPFYFFENGKMLENKKNLMLGHFF